MFAQITKYFKEQTKYDNVFIELVKEYPPLHPDDILISNFWNKWKDKNRIANWLVRRYKVYKLYQSCRRELNWYLEIWNAFTEVKLGDGIGIEKAWTIDDFCDEKDPRRMEARENDERDDWMKVHEVVKDWHWNERFSFMDVKGKLFHLPVLILVNFDALDYHFLSMVEFEENTDDCQNIEWQQDSYKKACELLNLLTPAQKKVIVTYYERRIDYDYYVNSEHTKRGNVISEYYCTCCKSIHKSYEEIPMTREEKIAEIESSEDYRIWQYLKKKFSN